MFIAGIPAYLLCSLVKFSPFINVLLKMTICTVVPNIIIIALFYNTKEMKYILRLIKGILNGILRKIKK